MQGLLAQTLDNGIRYLAMHYTADEDKRGPWAANKKVGVPVREWLREMEMVEAIYDGEPVFGDFREQLHSYANYGEGRLPIIPGSTYIGGWDCGQTLIPAFTLLQISPEPHRQVHAILEVTSPGAEPMEKFAPRVGQALMKLLPGSWPDIEHWADTTVTTANGANGQTAQQVAAKYGFRLRQSSNVWLSRQNAVTWLLMDMIEAEMPRFIVDPEGCPLLFAGFQGAYKLDDDIKGAVGPDRVLKAMPVKNMYSHVHDSLQYAAMRAEKALRLGRGLGATESGVVSGIRGFRVSG